MTLVGLNSGLTIANETAITKEGSRRLRNDSESHTTSLLDNRERNYRQSSVIVCSLLTQCPESGGGRSRSCCHLSWSSWQCCLGAGDTTANAIVRLKRFDHQHGVIKIISSLKFWRRHWKCRLGTMVTQCPESPDCWPLWRREEPQLLPPFLEQLAMLLGWLEIPSPMLVCD